MFTTPVLGRFQQEQGNQGDSDSDGDEAERECDARKNLKETQPELRNKEQGNQGDSDSVCDEAERECDARKNLKETQPELRNKVLLAMCMGLKVHTNNKGWCDPKVDEDYKMQRARQLCFPPQMTTNQRLSAASDLKILQAKTRLVARIVFQDARIGCVKTQL